MTGLVIRAGTVFRATDADAVLRDAWVRIEDGRVVEVSASELGASNSDVRFDEPNSTLMPGMIDCHVHFCLSGTPNWDAQAEEAYALACWRAERHAQDTLRAGVTTVRTLGGRDGLELALRDAQARGILEAPRVRAANRQVRMTGGHGLSYARDADGPDEVRKAVREQLRAGADVIKLMATGGVMTRGVESGAAQLTESELRAGIEEAHKAGKTTAAHAQGADGIENAIRAGIDSIEHGIYLTDWAVREMVVRGVYLSPTLSPPTYFASAQPGSVPQWVQEKSRRNDAAHMDSFRRAYEAGVKIVMGTDVGTPFNYHGANAHELKFMVDWGMEPVDVLRAATRNGSELLRLADEVGTIEVGKVADLVLCPGDVTKDVSLLTGPDGLRVFQAGRRITGRDGSQQVSGIASLA